MRFIVILIAISLLGGLWTTFEMIQHQKAKDIKEKYVEGLIKMAQEETEANAKHKRLLSDSRVKADLGLLGTVQDEQRKLKWELQKRREEWSMFFYHSLKNTQKYNIIFRVE